MSCPFPYIAGDLSKEGDEEQLADLKLLPFKVENDNSAVVKGSTKTTDGKKNTPFDSSQARQTYSQRGVLGYG